MRGMRQGATTVLKWFSALYVVLIVVQVYLAGEGIFGMSVVTKDKCDHASSACVDKSTSLIFGVDLTPVMDPGTDVKQYAMAYIDRFAKEVTARLGKLL